MPYDSVDSENISRVIDEAVARAQVYQGYAEEDPESPFLNVVFEGALGVAALTIAASIQGSEACMKFAAYMNCIGRVLYQANVSSHSLGRPAGKYLSWSYELCEKRRRPAVTPPSAPPPPPPPPPPPQPPVVTPREPSEETEEGTEPQPGSGGEPEPPKKPPPPSGPGSPPGGPPPGGPPPGGPPPAGPPPMPGPPSSGGGGSIGGENPFDVPYWPGKDVIGKNPPWPPANGADGLAVPAEDMEGKTWFGTDVPLSEPKPELSSVDWDAWKQKVAGAGVNVDDALCCWGMIWGEQMTALSGQSKKLCGPPPDVSDCNFDLRTFGAGGLRAALAVGGRLSLAFDGAVSEEMLKASFWIKPENRIEVGKSLCKGGNQEGSQGGGK